MTRITYFSDAVFVSTDEVAGPLERAGFVRPVIKQTLMADGDPERIEDGAGKGAFVVISVAKP